MTQVLLTAEGLEVSRNDRFLIGALDLVVRRGDCWALTGPNGSGKTTLLRALAGLHSEYSGRLSLAPQAFLGHKPALNLLLSPRANLEWYAALVGTSARAEERLAAVGLESSSRVPCGQLSAGQQRRVALAALALQPAPLWLLDEPHTALDVSGQALLDSLLHGHLARGGAVVCATHQPLDQTGRFQQLAEPGIDIKQGMALRRWQPRNG
ncbi:MAG: heme ABC exporter ATP-binding protein CcmA [Pseudomonadota bacterium]